MVFAPTIVPAPPRTPVPYGLFSVVDFQTGGDQRWFNGVQWEPLPCGPLNGIGDSCPPLPPPGSEPTVTTYDFNDGTTEGWTPIVGTATNVNSQLLIQQSTFDGAIVQLQTQTLPAGTTVSITGDYTVTSPGGYNYLYTSAGDASYIPLAEPGGVITNSVTLSADGFVVLRFSIYDEPNYSGTITLDNLVVTIVPPGGSSGLVIGFPKQALNSQGTVTATAFTVYAYEKCSPVGRSVADAQARAEATLAAYEENAVERFFWTGALGNTPNLSQAVSYSDWAGAECQLAQAFSGAQGVLHAGRDLVMQGLASQHLRLTGRTVTTKLGTPVVAGSGYPCGGWQIKGTSALIGYRSEPFTSTGRPGDLFDRGSNELHAIVERNYLLGYDVCPVPAPQ